VTRAQNWLDQVFFFLRFPGLEKNRQTKTKGRNSVVSHAAQMLDGYAINSGVIEISVV